MTTFSEILAARTRLAPFLAPTPLRNYPVLDAALGFRILVKHENHQPTNSFKIRNALAAMTALSPEQRQRGVIAATRGNHGAGIAWAGKILNIPATICVPLHNNPEKNAAMKSYGAQLIEQGDNYDDAVAVMNRLARELNLTQIHSTNHPDILAGAATLSLEILEQADAMHEPIDAMIFAIGGGSQACGAITLAKHFNRPIAVHGVQAANASAVHDSFHAGKITKPPAPTIADGLATGSAYELTFPTLLTGLSSFSLVTESEIAHALRLVLSTTHNLAEGAAAAALAGLIKLAPALRNKSAVLTLSGGNIDQPTLARILSHEL